MSLRGFGSGTDLEYLIEMGYDEDEAREALKQTRGDRVTALMFLQGIVPEEEAAAWRGEIEGDFTAGVSQKDQPSTGISRALWKSPIYCRVSSARLDTDGVTMYSIKAITKHGEEFVVERRYSHFANFKKELPLGTCQHFQNYFPVAGIWKLTGSSEIEKRRRMLEEWMREFCMDEKIMTTRVLLFKLYEFLGYDAGCEELMLKQEADGDQPVVRSKKRRDSFFRWAGKVLGQKPLTIPSRFSTVVASEGRQGRFSIGGSSIGSPKMASEQDSNKVATPGSNATWRTVSTPGTAAKAIQKSPETAASPDGPPQGRVVLKFDERTARTQSLTVLRNLSGIPLLSVSCNCAELHNFLPCKVEMTSVTGISKENSSSEEEKDNSVAQLRKDYARDRLIIQSHRLEGSKHSLEQFIVLMKQCINFVLVQNKRATLGTDVASEKTNADFCLQVLSSISRTHSAYLTHLKLLEICEQEPDNPLTVVPEGELADPIKICFSVKQRHSDAPVGTGDYCIVVEMEAGTVFRFSNTLDDDPRTLLQTRCTYCKTVFGMPSLNQVDSEKEGVGFPRSRGAVVLKLKQGKSWLLMQKEMMTTRRDWSSA